jgi:signal transduction histidine kinase/DNA-binding response OmpR family regulator
MMNRKKYKYSITAKIVASLLILGIVPGSIFSFYIMYYAVSGILRTSIGNSYKHIANSLSYQASTAISREFIEAERIAQSPQVQALLTSRFGSNSFEYSRDSIKSYLSLIALSEEDEYQRLQLIDTKGNVLADTRKSQNNQPTSKVDVSEFIGKSNYLGNLHRLEPGGEIMLDLVKQVSDMKTNKAIGYLRIELKLKGLFSSLKNYGNGHLIIVNGKGKVLYRAKRSKLRYNYLSVSSVKTPTWKIVKLQGKLLLLGVAPLKLDKQLTGGLLAQDNAWYVVVPQLLAVAYRPIYSLVFKFFVFGGIVILFILALGYWQGRRLSIPVKKLQKAAREIATGNLDSAVNVETGDELEDLAKEFNSMARQLKASRAWFKHTNEQLKQANKLKSEFLANMSHELRTPLNSIIGFAEILTDNLFGDLNEKQKKYVSNICSSGKHLLQLINDILDLSKIESGRLELSYHIFSVRQVIDQVCNTMQPLIDKKNLELTIRVDDGLMIAADEAKFKQILYNLISNAVKFTPAEGKVSIKASREAQNAVVSVSDTGIGIAKSDFDKVFSQFQQINGTHSKEYEGTGLGLALTKKLIELHGGNITFTSELNKGSTFTFKMPIDMPAGLLAKSENATRLCHLSDAPEKELMKVLSDYSTSQPVVLVVDDDSQAREILSIYLKEANYHVEVAKDGAEALSVIEKLKPFAVILDIMLPRVDGWAVLKELKSNPKTADMPVIIVSMIDNKQLGMALGAVEYLVKPINKSQLLATLSRCANQPQRDNDCFTVLVADDDCQTIELVVSLLESQGFKTISATSGKEAIACVKSKRPDALVLDLLMPEVSGFDVVATLKADPETSYIPIILLTGKEMTDEDYRRLNSHIFRVFEKSSFKKENLLQELFNIEKLHPEEAKLIDPATSLYNRRYLEKKLSEEIYRAQRYNVNKFALLELDFSELAAEIKPVKNGNGDRLPSVLTADLAVLFNKITRKVDTLTVYQTNKLVVLLPETTIRGARSIAEKLATEFLRYKFGRVDKDVCKKILFSIIIYQLKYDTPQKCLEALELEKLPLLKISGDEVARKE